MKHFCLLFFLFTTCHSFSQKSNDSAAFNKIYRLVDKGNYFKARDIYRTNKNDLSKFHQAVIEANLDYGFNQPKLSNEQVVIAMKYKDFHQLADSIQANLYYTQADNYIRLYQYSDAESIYQKIKDNHFYFIEKDSERTTALKDKLSMFHSLRNVPKQEVVIQNNDSIQLIKDAFRLKNIPVARDNDSDYFVFDTGAGFSMVPETTAKTFKMHILDGLTSIGTATGKSVKAHIAVCDELYINDIEIKNAVFFVVPDSAIFFPQYNYQIHGIIGFPVIEALKEIQITKDDRLIIPKQETEWNESNLSLSNNSLCISIDDTAYTFDTGANETWLNNKYYEANKKEIEAHYQKENYTHGAIGGTDTVAEYLIDFVTTVNGKKLTVPNVNVSTKESGFNKDVDTYGNIGQDFIHQFNKMTINFDKMFIKFDN